MRFFMGRQESRRVLSGRNRSRRQPQRRAAFRAPQARPRPQLRHQHTGATLAAIDRMRSISKRRHNAAALKANFETSGKQSPGSTGPQPAAARRDAHAILPF